MASATGCRRGEVLALRWCDIRNDAAFADRPLRQTRDGLVFKSTKTEAPRRIELPPATMPLLARHRERQDEFRRQCAEWGAGPAGLFYLVRLRRIRFAPTRPSAPSSITLKVAGSGTESPPTTRSAAEMP
jgi:integrase